MIGKKVFQYESNGKDVTLKIQDKIFILSIRELDALFDLLAFILDRRKPLPKITHERKIG